MNNKTNELITSLIFPIFVVIFCVCYLVSTRGLKIEILRYPFFMIAGLAILVVLIAMDEIKKIKRQPNVGKKENVLEKFKKFDIKGIAFLIITSVIYLILIPVVGYFSITWAFTIFLMYWLGERKIIKVVIISTGFIIMQYVVFQVFLYLPIPTGFFI